MPIDYTVQHFHKTEDASVALDALDGSDFMEARLLVQVSPPLPLPPSVAGRYVWKDVGGA